ncbi:MAG: hypothetical protein JKY93_12650 [Gammaproteobacteria bacterium]|nr:hypothetical protein [Gammaproteobacteria bacterium]
MDIELSWDGGTSWTTPADNTSWTTCVTFVGCGDQLKTLGGNTDTWGRTWNYDDLSDTNFRVRATHSSGTKTEIDYIKVNVHYSADATQPSVSNNTGTDVDEGNSVILTNAMLSATDAGTADNLLIFTPSNISNGSITVSDIVSATFTQDDIDNNRVKYVHDGSKTTTGDFDFSVEDLANNILSGQSFTIIVNIVNDAPVLADATPTLTALTEDNSNPTGNTVAFIVVDGSVTDNDGAVESIAVIATDNTNGTWQYNTGSGWIAFGSPTAAAARLLNFTESIRYVPNGDSIASATITFRAWDESSGTTGATADTTSNGTNAAFSTVTDTASISITAENDAPVLDNSQAPSLTAVTEDDINPTCNTVASIVVDNSITDVDGGAVESIAVTAVDNTNGTWQFDTGSGWSAFGTPTVSTALLLDAADSIRYIPNADSVALVSITFRAWDTTTGSAGNVADTTVNGSTSTFSTATDSASISITPVNDAPVLADLTPTLTAVAEDDSNPSADSVASMVADGSITDADGVAVESIAVTAVDNSNGIWQYDTGAGWIAFGSPSIASARLLDAADSIRYIPSANSNSSATITFRAWDTSTGSAGSTADTTVTGTTTAFSTTTDSATITVTPENDAPVLADALPTLTTINEDNAAPTGDTVASIVVDGSITDAEVAVESIAVTAVDNTNGTWQFDSGSGWANVVGATNSNALLLDSADSMRFIPTANFNGSATFTFRAWDTTTETAGTYVDSSINGTATPYSTFSDTASIDITSINDAPVLGNAAPTLSTIAVDNFTSTGNTVATIVVDGSITDNDGAVEAIAVTAVDNTNGAWQFDTGSGWTAFTGTTTSNAMILDSGDSIRFVPNASYSGSASMTFRAWDTTTGSSGSYVNTSTNGDPTPYSSATDTAAISVISASPGGVPTNLRLWYDADIGVSGTTSVTQWDNQSGVAGFDLTQGNAAYQPALNVASSNMNFHRSLELDSDLLATTGVLASNTEDMTVFTVLEVDASAATYNKVWGMGPGTDQPGSQFYASGQLFFYDGVGDKWSDANASEPLPYTEPVIRTDNLIYPGSDGSSYVYLNGDVNPDTLTLSTVNGGTGVFELGGSTTADEDLDGRIAEFILFRSNLSATNQQQVETYLAIKYGIHLANDYLDSAGATVYSVATYGSDVFGLAKDIAGSLDQRISRAANDTAGLVISTDTDYTSANTSHTNSISNGSYLLLGHDGTTTTAINGGDTPSGSSFIERIDRVWKVQQTGSIGSVNLSFSSLHALNANEEYVLLEDSDSDGTFSDGHTELATSSTLAFTGITFSAGTSYVTVGIRYANDAPVLTDQTPLGEVPKPIHQENEIEDNLCREVCQEALLQG